MSLKYKNGGSYADVAGLFVKKSGVYTAVAGLFVKQSGAYTNFLSVYKFSSNRTEFPSSAGVISTAGTVWQADKVSFKAPPDRDVKAPVCVWPAFYVTGTTNEVNLGNDIPIRNASLFINGVFYKAFKFSGADGTTVLNGSWAMNDPDDTMVIPAGAEFSIVTQTVVPAGQYRATTYYDQSNDYSAKSGVSNRDAYMNGTTAFPIPNTFFGNQLYGPCCIVGKGWVAGNNPAPLIVGDSIGWGANDRNAFLSTDGVFGYINRALNDTTGPGRYSYGNFCAPGTRLSGLADTGFSKRKAILVALGMPFTCILNQMGINTPSTSRITDWESTAGPYLRGMAGSKKIIGLCLAPQVLISDGTRGTNLTSQLVQDNSQWNNYLKNTGGTRQYFDTYIDSTSGFESTPGSGKFAVPAFTSTLVNAISGSTTTFTLSAKPEVDDALIINPGASSLTAKMVRSVVQNADGINWDVTTYFAFTATVAAGTVVAATNSEDGTHPTTQISKTAKNLIVAAKVSRVFDDTAANLVMAGARTAIPGSGTAANTNSYTQFQQWSVIQVQETGTELEVDFGNFASGSAPGSSNLTLTVGVGTASTGVARTNGIWKKSGTASVTLTPGEVGTAVFYGSFTRGQLLYFCWFGTYATAPANWPNFGAGNQGNEVGSSLTDKTALAGINGGANVFGTTLLAPLAIRVKLAATASPFNTYRINILGDSITSNGELDSGELSAANVRYSGYVYRGLFTLALPYMTNGYSGLGASAVIGESTTNRAIRESEVYSSVNKITHNLIAVCTNDLVSVTNDTQFTLLKNNILALVARDTAAGIKSIVFTAPPRTNTTNTTSVVPYRAQYNAWVKATFPRVYDIGVVLQDTTNTDLWLTTYPAADGVHPNNTGHTAAKADFISKLPALLAI